MAGRKQHAGLGVRESRELPRLGAGDAISRGRAAAQTQIFTGKL